MRQQIVKALPGVLVALMLAMPALPAAAAEVCYQDEDGRIVKRRRPGFREVPCPGSEAAAAAEAAAAITDEPVATTERRLPGAREGELTWGAVPAREPNPSSGVPRPGLEDYVARVPVPDRWRIVEGLGYEDDWFNPYNRNTLKGDRPVHGEWFFNMALISDSIYEVRDVPTPVGGNSTGSAGQIDVFRLLRSVGGGREPAHGIRLPER